MTARVVPIGDRPCGTVAADLNRIVVEVINLARDALVIGKT